MRSNSGFTLAELSIFLSALLIPIFFLIYYSPGIAARVQEYRIEKKLRQISWGLHIYAAQDNAQFFPQGSSAEEVFRRIFVKGNLRDPDVFDDPRLPNGKPSGTPGPWFMSPSTDLTGVDFLYTKEPLSLNSDPRKIIVLTQNPGVSLPEHYLALHLDGSVTHEKKLPPGEFV